MPTPHAVFGRPRMMHPKANGMSLPTGLRHKHSMDARRVSDAYGPCHFSGAGIASPGPNSCEHIKGLPAARRSDRFHQHPRPE